MTKMMDGNNTTTLKAFSITAKGEKHIRNEMPCQDHSSSSDGEKYSYAIVCDGHGGSLYCRSDRGSRLATQVTKNAFKEFYKGITRTNKKSGIKQLFQQHPDDIIKHLIKNIISSWYDSVKADFEKYGSRFSEDELKNLSDNSRLTLEKPDGWIKAYGTTLLAIFSTPKFWFGIHIGDGKCVSINEKGEMYQPIPWDNNCFLNITTSLCDTDAYKNFRYVYENRNIPIAIYIATDGIDDTFGNDDSLHNFYRTISKLFAENGINEAKKDLKEYLPLLSKQGSRDDVSIAGIFDWQKFNRHIAYGKY